MPSTPKPPATVAPATKVWDVKQLTTIRPGPALGPLLQARTLPHLSPGQVARRDLARYYLIIGASHALDPAAHLLLVKTADLPIPLPEPTVRASLITACDAGEVSRAQQAAPSVSPFLRPEDAS